MKNPIDKEQRSRLNGARRQLVETVDLINRCKACGIDVTDREEAAFAMSQQLDALMAQFMGVSPDSQAVPPEDQAAAGGQATRRPKTGSYTNKTGG